MFSDYADPFSIPNPLQNMGDNSCACAADILCHAEGGIFHLIYSGLAAQLGDQIDQFIDSGCADGMSTPFQTAHRANGQATIQGEFTVFSLIGRATHSSETTGFEAEGSHNGKGIVNLKHINIVRGDTSLCVSLMCARINAPQRRNNSPRSANPIESVTEALALTRTIGWVLMF